MPASELVLSQFVSYLAREKLTHRTIKVYLSAVRFLHIEGGMDDPFKPPLLRLEYILKGIKWTEAQQRNGARERLPISPGILRKIKAVWESSALDPDVVMLWAACCVAFFGFLRVGELTVGSDDSYDASVHLSLGDIAVDNPASPTMVRLSIKQSKTDPFRQGVDIFLGKTSTDLCPVVALLNYLVVRGRNPGALFHFRDGRLLTRQRFVEAVKARYTVLTKKEIIQAVSRLNKDDQEEEDKLLEDEPAAPSHSETYTRLSTCIQWLQAQAD